MKLTEKEYRSKIEEALSCDLVDGQKMLDKFAPGYTLSPRRDGTIFILNEKDRPVAKRFYRQANKKFPAGFQIRIWPYDRNLRNARRTK